MARKQGNNIYNWSAKRSGAFIRVSGTDADGNPIKVTATLIELTPNHGLVARCQNGDTLTTWNLATSF